MCGIKRRLIMINIFMKSENLKFKTQKLFHLSFPARTNFINYYYKKGENKI